VGWVFPAEGLHHLKLTLNKMDLHDDMDPDPGDCECTFFWMNVDRAPNAWIRLSTFATGNMNDYDDDDGLGDGEMGFSGAVFDFYVANGQEFTVRAHGYDQDCLDDRFGNFVIGSVVGGSVVPNGNAFLLIDCYAGTGPLSLETGDNDDYNQLSATFGPAGNYGVGAQDVTAGGQYELEFRIEDIALTVEDSADLVLTKLCKPDDTVLAGEQVTCTILVDNPGPGLPRNVVVRDLLVTNIDPSKYTMGAPTFVFRGFAGAPNPCTVTPPNQFTCELGTVPINGQAIISVTFVANEPGSLNNTARVSTDSTDPNLNNNQAVDGVTVLPKSDLRLTKSGTPNPVVAGTNLTYTLTVSNNGPSTAQNVTIKDVLPAAVVVASVTPGAGNSCTPGVPGDALQPLTCNMGTLANGASESVTLVVTVLASTPAGTTLLNQATASSDSVDPNNGDNKASASTTVNTSADVVIVKTSDAAAYKPSTQVKYQITITNTGPSKALNVVATDNLPDIKQAIYQSDTAGCVKSTPTTLVCNMGDLTVGQSKTFFVYVNIKGSQGNVSNTASVASSTPDPNGANNTSTRVVLIQGGVKVGAAVTSLDAKSVGTVQGLTDSNVLVRRQGAPDLYVPWSAIADVTDQAVKLKVSAAQVATMQWGQPTR
jgi:uncharacterized repeat protein (TIGR01451 family)